MSYGSLKDEWMKYICLGYIEPGTFEGMTEDERQAVLDECFEHNDHLRANGHLAEVPLRPPETAVTLYWKNGKDLYPDLTVGLGCVGPSAL
jgi:hypothetical protein